MSWSGVFAAVERTDTPLLFFGAAAAAFIAVLVTGIVGEIRSIRDRVAAEEANEPLPRSLRLQLVAIAILLFLALAGGLLSLSVLVDPPAHKAEQLAVSFLLSTTVIGLSLLMLGSLAEYRPREFKRVALIAVSVLLVLLGGAGLYLISVALEENTKTYTYRVYGTCAAGSCGLNERSEPSASSEPLGQLRDGDEVELVCQELGGLNTATNGLKSKIWDKLSNGAFVSDIFINTPPVGSEIPAC